MHAYLTKPHRHRNHIPEEPIMTNNFQPSEDIFDDVEGHAVKSGRIETPETDDVEGHAVKSGRIEATETDVEGHGFRGNAVDDGDDDVEGHGVRVRF